MSKNAGSQSGASTAVENLVGSDELVRLLLDAAGEGIYGVDLEGNCTFANPACLRLVGYESGEELLKRNMHELVHHTPGWSCERFFADGAGCPVSVEGDSPLSAFGARKPFGLK